MVLVSNVLPFHPPSTGGKGALGHVIAAAECTSPWYLAQLGWSWWLAWWSCSLACVPSAIRACAASHTSLSLTSNLRSRGCTEVKVKWWLEDRLGFLSESLWKSMGEHIFPRSLSHSTCFSPSLSHLSPEAVFVFRMCRCPLLSWPQNQEQRLGTCNQSFCMKDNRNEENYDWIIKKHSYH